MMKRRHRPPTTSSEIPRRGFTLLEVLLTAMLSATLLLGLWTLFGTFLRLFKVGEVKAQRSQMVRAITQQFSSDLMGVIQPAQHDRFASDNSHQLALFSQSAAENSTSSSGSEADSSQATIVQIAGTSLSASLASPSLTMPRFGLKGTETSLRLDVLQTSLDTRPPTDPDDIFNENEQPVGPRASELRTIAYSFRERSDYSQSEREPAERKPATGLLRQEFAWEIGSLGMLRSNRNKERSRRRPIRSGVSDENSFPELTEEELLEAEAFDELLLWVPEVVGLEFRYFDGREWRSQWDSHQTKSLPVAVEMIVELTFEQKSHNGNHESTTKIGKKQSADSDETDERDRGYRDLSVYRQLVYLPFAQGGTP